MCRCGCRWLCEVLLGRGRPCDSRVSLWKHRTRDPLVRLGLSILWRPSWRTEICSISAVVLSTGEHLRSYVSGSTVAHCICGITSGQRTTDCSAIRTLYCKPDFSKTCWHVAMYFATCSTAIFHPSSRLDTARHAPRLQGDPWE